MPTVHFEILLPRTLDEVWDFHMDVIANLPRLSPPEQQVRILSADVPLHAGSKLIVAARGPMGITLRWVGVIVEVAPPHDQPNGRAARFVDEMESGPFAAWRHEHLMEQVDAGTTRLLDRISYALPLGPLGWIADSFLVRSQLNAMFAHRHAEMRRWAAQQTPAPPGKAAV